MGSSLLCCCCTGTVDDPESFIVCILSLFLAFLLSHLVNGFLAHSIDNGAGFVLGQFGVADGVRLEGGRGIGLEESSWGYH